jgi:hypothetical protein
MGRTGYFLPEHGWSSSSVAPKSAAPTLATFTYPGTIDSIAPITAMPGVSTTDVVDEEDEDNDADADDNDSASPSGSVHSTVRFSLFFSVSASLILALQYPDGLISGSDIPQEYRAEVDRVFIKYLNRICSNRNSFSGCYCFLLIPSFSFLLQWMQRTTKGIPYTNN